MKAEALRALLEQVQGGGLSVDEAASALKDLPFKDLGYARVDTHREVRAGAPEVVFGQSKTPAQIAGIARALLDDDADVLITRAPPGAIDAVRKEAEDAELHEPARCITVVRHDRPSPGRIAVLAAGTSDLPVAEEAAVTARFLGAAVDTIYDVGVAGLHRLLAELERLRTYDVVIVVAGMDGALPSVVGGLLAQPVIAVPTSVGYGASFGGVSALLSNLNACSAGVVVVNIDNGFGAARAAQRMLAGPGEARAEEPA